MSHHLALKVFFFFLKTPQNLTRSIWNVNMEIILFNIGFQFDKKKLYNKTKCEKNIYIYSKASKSSVCHITFNAFI